MEFRFDKRNKQQFCKDIKEGHQKELDIAIRLCLKIHHKTGTWPQLVPNGIDFSGEFIQDAKKINSAQDFIIENRLIEITRSDSECKKYFHEKCGKVHRAIRQKSDMIFVNGLIQFKQPKFIQMTSIQLEELTNKSIAKYGKTLGANWNKPSYRYDIFWIDELGWEILPEMIDLDKIPKEYKELINLTKG